MNQHFQLKISEEPPLGLPRRTKPLPRRRVTPPEKGTCLRLGEERRDEINVPIFSPIIGLFPNSIYTILVIDQKEEEKPREGGHTLILGFSL